VGLILLKEGAEQFETGKRIAFIFHGKDMEKLGTVVDECDEILVALPRDNFVRPYIRMDELTWSGGSMGCP
jgi:hypothetical protein